MYSALNKLSEYIYFYISKTLLHALFCLFLRSSKVVSVSLNKPEPSADVNGLKELIYRATVKDSFWRKSQPLKISQAQ